MADRNVANTATLDTLRTTYNSTAVDVGDIASVTGASGVIGAATDTVSYTHLTLPTKRIV